MRPTKFHVGLLAAAAMLVSASYAARAETLSYATWQPEASSDLHAVSLHWLIEQLEERTNGEHRIRMHWGGTVAGIDEIGDAVESGIADKGDLVVPYFPDRLPLNNAISFFWPQPNTPLELGELMAELHREYPQFSEELERYNMKLLGLRPLGYYGILCSEPVRSLEDFEGKRIRSYGLALPAAIEAVGGVPVSMSTVETYEALQRGVLDCTPIEPIIARGWNYDEVARYYIDVPLGASWGQFIVINSDVFDGLSEDLQNTLVELGEDYLTHFTDEQVRLTEEVLADWEAREDFEIIAFDRDAFLDATENDPQVQQVRQNWIDLAKEAGVPGDEIAQRLSFDR